MFSDTAMTEMQNLDLSDSAGDYRSDMADGPTQQRDSSSSPRAMLATTIPRRRVVLDWDSVNKQISAPVVVRNRSKDVFAFKYETDCGLITAQPDGGILFPGEQTALTLLLNENCDPTRVFESDCCELLILPFRQDLIQMTDDADLEEFVRSAFHDDTPLEKHVFSPTISSLANARLNIVAAEKEEKKKRDKEIQHLKKTIYPAVSVIIALLMLYILCTEFCQPPEEPRRW